MSPMMARLRALASAQSGYDEADAKTTAELADLIEQIYEEDLEMINE